MIPRRDTLPDHSFLLFGPRGTGKTTWLKHRLPNTQMLITMGADSQSLATNLTVKMTVKPER